VFLWGDAHLLAEKLPQLPTDEPIVASEGTMLGTPAAQAAPISQLREAGHGRPVELNVIPRESGKKFPPLPDIFVNDPPKDL